MFQWLAKYPEFARLYAEARDDQIDGLAGDATEIACTEPDLARARLMINTCFLRIGRMRPKSIGNRPADTKLESHSPRLPQHTQPQPVSAFWTPHAYPAHDLTNGANAPREGKTKDQKIRACLKAPVGTATGANCLNREGKTKSTHGPSKKLRFKAIVPKPRPPLLTKTGAS